ncbi:MAG: PspC domain-containing protein [Gammaproteobacteria bacterium]|nr:PspC domain-containing protein [Gammaproteobacteria bacterium]
MNGPGEDRRGHRRTEPGASPEERIQQAVDRIEQAARDLSASATDRAADYIEGVADRISPKTRSRARRERVPTWPWSGQPRTPRLSRDTENGKLLGVCAGIANYYGLETWVVRLIVLTGLIFLTSVTLVGYFVAALLMDPSPMRKRRSRERRGRSKRRGDRRRTKDRSPEEYAWIPRQRLRDVGAEFDQMELKLRRMEAHVTSGHYELHRELAELEKRDAGSSTSRSG